MVWSDNHICCFRTTSDRATAACEKNKPADQTHHQSFPPRRPSAKGLEIQKTILNCFEFDLLKSQSIFLVVVVVVVAVVVVAAVVVQASHTPSRPSANGLKFQENLF